MHKRILSVAVVFLFSAIASAQPNYTIETIAGNGKRGDTPDSKSGVSVPVDLPFGVEIGPDRQLYITTVGSHRILRLNLKSGKLVSVAGNGKRGYSGDGGLATNASLNEPYEVRFDSKGNMLILEMKNHLLRKVDVKTKRISTLAGDGKAGSRGDGKLAKTARLKYPHSLILDKHDNIFIADLANHRVRRIDAKTGRIETVAGNGKSGFPRDGAQAKSQPLMTPQGIAIHDGYLWIASFRGQVVWRMHLIKGTIEHVSGTGKRGFTGDGGDPKKATFDGPRGVTMSRSGILYVVEGENNIIRALDTRKNSIYTIAGVGPKKHKFNADGISALKAPLWQPHGVIVAPDGSLIISDTINHRVRRLKR